MKAKKNYIYFTTHKPNYTWFLLRAASNPCNIIPLLLVNLEFSLLNIFLFCFVFIFFFLVEMNLWILMSILDFCFTICFYSKEYMGISQCCDGIQSILFLFWLYPRCKNRMVFWSGKKLIIEVDKCYCFWWNDFQGN